VESKHPTGAATATAYKKFSTKKNFFGQNKKRNLVPKKGPDTSAIVEF
jgi:hypothetical protein